jgi:hypothetical protein
MNARKLISPLVVALALAATPSLAGAAAPLRIESVAVGTKAGPLVLQVGAGVHADVALTVNGKKVDHPFEAVGPRSQRIELRSTDNLHAGPDKLRLRATGAGGTRTASRTVEVPGWALLADAGGDTPTYVDTHTRLGAAPLPADSRDRVDYTWKVVAAPRGAKVRLVGHGKAEPVLRAAEPGTYVLQEEANPEAPGVPTSYDRVSVPVAADVPPIGLALDTDAGGQIAIGGERYGFVGQTGMAYAVVERTTGTVVDSGHVNGDPSGVAALDQLVGKYDDPNSYMRYLLIVSGRGGVEAAALDKFAEVLKKIGVALPSEENFLALRYGLPFSIVGSPGALPGAATTRIPGGGYDPPVPGAITGYLEKNQAVNSAGAPVYEYVAGGDVEYDTRASGSSATKNVMTVEGQKYEASLPAGATAGFHLVVLESMTLRPLANLALVTNAAGGSDRERQAEVARKLRTEMNQAGGPVVLLQTIGKPKAAGPEWAGVVSQLTAFGADPQLVDALDGSSEYSFVSRFGAAAPPAESSTAYDKGPYPAPNLPPAHLIGVLARSRTSNFVPLLAGTPPTNRPEGLINIGLMKVAYQAPQAWPELAPKASRDEAAAAARYLCEGVGFCQKVSSCDSIRECFWKKYESDWPAKAAKLGDLKFADGKGFTNATFEAVREELKTEAGEVGEIHTWLTKILAPVEKSSPSSYVDLQAIGEKVWDSVQRPAPSNTVSWALGAIGKVAAVGELAGPPASAAAAGTAALFGAASYFSEKGGQPILGTEIKVRGAELAKELYARVQLAREETAALGMLIVSDYGKLSTTYSHVDSDWQPPADARATEAMTIGAKQWFYEALIPTAYPYLIRADGASNARSLVCTGTGTEARSSWPNQPDADQMNATTGYRADGSPETSIFFFSLGRGGQSAPPASLAEEMFRPIGAKEPGVGLEKLRFFTSRVFNGQITHAIDNTTACSVGFLPNH